MRQGTSLLASLEGMSHTAFRIARELSQGGRSGLTPMFLARKLDIPEEEVEYCVDVHHGVMYTNITRICLTTEGRSLIRRLQEGLASRGDAQFLLQHVHTLSDYGVQQLEEMIDIEGSPSKSKLSRSVLKLLYAFPDTLEKHVATGNYSPLAKDIFNTVWNSSSGRLTIEDIHMMHRVGSVELEKALQELLRSYALFELFRFNDEGFLARHVALLKELRECRFTIDDASGVLEEGLQTLRGNIEEFRSAGMGFTDLISRLLASIAARPCRERKDAHILKMTHGLFKEDRRRLEEIVPEEHDPPLDEFLSTAYAMRWLCTVDNVVKVKEITPLLSMSRLDRHRLIFARQCSSHQSSFHYDLVVKTLETHGADGWYSIRDFARCAIALHDGLERPMLRRTSRGYEYTYPRPAQQLFDQLCRFITEEMSWMGLVDRGYCEGEPAFRVSALGAAFLSNDFSSVDEDTYPSSLGAIVVQPNFEIMASLEQMDPLCTIPLYIFGERENNTAVGVFRLTRERFIQALQQGHDPVAFLEFLEKSNRGELPESVVITLRDWMGNAKRVRLRTYHVIESDDPMVIAELAHHPKWTENFTEVDGTKTLRYESFSRQELAAALEKEGFIIR